ncbi:Cyclic nucleotide-binding domain protein [Tepidimonas thermarum]|uniref:Cyclic nucleotide-binding domain protein n=2 Tax=Tepidimonas thermarum TaxID=335431 RepID=A0A554WX87_9BURK|nr:Cyclic nucleotide-binding domain protein [Tepidimonas thermarum]
MRCTDCVRAAGCLLARLPASQAHGMVREHAVPAGTTLLHQDEPVRRLVTVKVGLLALRRRVPEGPARTIAVIGPGRTVGLRALVGQDAAALDAHALTPVRVCLRPVVPGALEVPVPAVLSELTRLAETLADWAAIGRLPTATQRVEAVLRRLAVAVQSPCVQLPQRQVLAELAACAPETVSRALGALARAGRVRRGPRRNAWVLAETTHGSTPQRPLA